MKEDGRREIQDMAEEKADGWSAAAGTGQVWESAEALFRACLAVSMEKAKMADLSRVFEVLSFAQEEDRFGRRLDACLFLSLCAPERQEEFAEQIFSCAEDFLESETTHPADALFPYFLLAAEAEEKRSPEARGIAGRILQKWIALTETVNSREHQRRLFLRVLACFHGIPEETWLIAHDRKGLALLYETAGQMKLEKESFAMAGKYFLLEADLWSRERNDAGEERARLWHLVCLLLGQGVTKELEELSKKCAEMDFSRRAGDENAALCLLLLLGICDLACRLEPMQGYLKELEGWIRNAPEGQTREQIRRMHAIFCGRYCELNQNSAGARSWYRRAKKCRLPEQEVPWYAGSLLSLEAAMYRTCRREHSRREAGRRLKLLLKMAGGRMRVPGLSQPDLFSLYGDACLLEPGEVDPDTEKICAGILSRLSAADHGIRPESGLRFLIPRMREEKDPVRARQYAEDAWNLLMECGETLKKPRLPADAWLAAAEVYTELGSAYDFYAVKALNRAELLSRMDENSIYAGRREYLYARRLLLSMKKGPAPVLQGDRDLARSALEHYQISLSVYQKRLQSAARYLDDEKLSDVLSGIEEITKECHLLYRDLEDADSCWSWILQNRNPAELPVQSRTSSERNAERRFALQKIQRLRCEIAERWKERQVLEEVQDAPWDLLQEEERLRDRLRETEDQMAQDPGKAAAWDLPAPDYRHAVPEGTAVLEIVVYSRLPLCSRFEAARIQKEGKEDSLLRIDLYLAWKTNGSTTQKRWEIDRVPKVAADVREFLDKENQRARGEESFADDIKREELLQVLYEDFALSEVLSAVPEKMPVFLAADVFADLPFELLKSRQGERLSDRHPISRILSLGDFMREKKEGKPQRSVVFGCPDFYPDSGEGDETGKNRFAGFSGEEEVPPLPFTLLEAEDVREKTDALCYAGKAASRNAFLKVRSPRVLHIATHGYFDFDALPGCGQLCEGFLLAGAGTFLLKKQALEAYGTGFVSAAEIAGMDLSGTELVVLSACLSGRSRTGQPGKPASAGQQLGLIRAFRDAGAKYVIANLWNSDDLASLILMDLFYDEWRAGKKPPEALQSAKEQIQTRTVQQILERWEEPAARAGKASEDALMSLREYGDLSFCPFRDSAYWGGWICFQSQS